MKNKMKNQISKQEKMEEKETIKKMRFCQMIKKTKQQMSMVRLDQIINNLNL